MENNKLESGFKIVNLLLIESSFKREVAVNFEGSESKNNISVNVQTNGTHIIVTETLDFIQKQGDTDEVTVKITMVGVFEKVGEVNIDNEDFGYINGAAIIFPYIREHLTSLCAKAGIGLVILPPFNFARKLEKKETQVL